MVLVDTRHVTSLELCGFLGQIWDREGDGGWALSGGYNTGSVKTLGGEVLVVRALAQSARRKETRQADRRLVSQTRPRDRISKG